VNHYRINYQLLQNYNYNLDDLERMMPWEREIYITLLMEDLKKQEADRQGS
jgi:hypothetical protein